MATVYKRPDLYVEEVRRTERPIEGASTSITAFYGITQKGPIGVPTRIKGFNDYTRIFGDTLLGEALAYAVSGFFKNGGAEAIIIRLGHYDDVTTGEIAAEAASIDLDGGSVAGAATFTGDADVSAGVPLLTAGLSCGLNVDVSGVKTATFDHAPASVSDAAGGDYVAATANTTATYKVNGGPTRALTVTVGTNTAAEYAHVMATLMDGVRVYESGGAVIVETDRSGSGASFEWVAFGSDFDTRTGFGVGTTAGTGDVADSEAVTFAEIKAVIEEDVKTAVAGDLLIVTQDADNGFLVFTTATSGAASEIDLATCDAELLAALGLSGLGSQGGEDTVTGAASVAVPALTVKAGYLGNDSPGLYGNRLSVEVLDDPKRPSVAAGSDLTADVGAGDTDLYMSSISGVINRGYILLTDGATTEYVEVKSSLTELVAGVAKHRVTLQDPTVNAYVAATSTAQSVEHTLIVYLDNVELTRASQISMSPNADHYVVAQVNDKVVGNIHIAVEDLGAAVYNNVLTAAAKADLTGGTDERVGLVAVDIIGDSGGSSGLYALDEIDDASLFAVPPSFGGVTTIPESSDVQNAQLIYAGNRQNLFAILDTPDNSLPAEAINYRENVLGADTDWGALYYPHLEVPDPIGVGRAPTVFVPPSGHLAGLYARVDRIDPPDGGVSAAPAGSGNFGKLQGVVGLRHNTSDEDHGLLNVAGVNVIKRVTKTGLGSTGGYLVVGTRTLSSGLEFRYIPVRRLFTFVEQSVLAGTYWALFKKNGPVTWRRVARNIESFLAGVHSNEQLAGDTADEAYYVKLDGTTTSDDDILNGRMNIEMGLSPHRPNEFIIFKVHQMAENAGVTE